MKQKKHITASIVLYRENIEDLKKTIASFLSTPLSKKLYLVDNTPNKQFKTVFTNTNEIEYIAVGKNIGFGSGHNKVLDKIKNTSAYHLILNPDVTFSPETISNLIEALKNDEMLAMIAPRVLFPDGRHQYSCRKYPSAKELLARKFSLFNTFFKETVYKGEYRDKDLTKPFYAEYLTGCFHLYKTADLIALNGFDERYFLYMEDVDICKKIDEIGKKKLYYPQEKIYHILKKGSSKSFSLFLRHFFSALKYFLKWK